MKRTIARLLAAVALFAGLSSATLANTGGPALDRFPKDRVTDMAALQHGAKLFVNYCLNCHAAAYMRYNRLRDIELTEAQIKQNLLFAGDKVGDLMTVSISAKDAKAWFGAQPPDLSVIARSRAGDGGSGADYLYTYMRTFYRDETKATGWNNLVFPAVACRMCSGNCRASNGPSLKKRKTLTIPPSRTMCSNALSRSSPAR